MAPFTLLADSNTYVACDWDLSLDPAGRQYWVDLFKRHFETILSQAVKSAATDGTAEQAQAAVAPCRRLLHDRLEAFELNPHEYGRVTILTLDAWRDDALRTYGFVDAFRDLKNRENTLALKLLPMVCRQLDVIEDPGEQFRAVIEGVFAGNIFDMGSEATAQAFLDASPDFFATRDRLPRRPWLIDNYDALADRMLRRPRHAKAIFFIDNAGSDFLLGAVPMIRWLARRGTAVGIAANERPTLNDMTAHDVRAWWPRILNAEPSLAPLPITTVSTGTGEPLIDLSSVSDDLNQAAADADLVILEGMGRGVESNLRAEFRCDAVNLAMVKDEAVAKRNGGKLFDVVCRYR